MNKKSFVAFVALLWIAIAAAGNSKLQDRFAISRPTQEENQMTAHATGTFEVKLVPQQVEENMKSAGFGRMSIEKQIHGDIEGTSVGQMMTTKYDRKNSGGYVAVEHVSARLLGRAGSFDLVHVGIMDRGKPSLTITVVPDSGTEQLEGITGAFNVIITDGKHSYDFAYNLPKHD